MRLVDWGRALVAVPVFCGAIAVARAEPVGRAASVVPSADFTRGTIVRTLTINEALEQDDRIRTSQDGSIQVRFLDDTLLTIGPNSEILLDKFVFDGATAKNLSIEVVRGAMRFVSGTSNHAAYEIKTPVATIGVRGTVVDLGYVNGHWIHNTISGAITGCLRGTSTCRDYTAGDLAFSVGASGFLSINPSETKQLFHELDQTHVTLAHVVGQNPSAPSGAADTTGSTGAHPGPGTGGPPSTGGPATGDGTGTGLVGCTNNCAPPPPPPPPPPCTTAACLGIAASPTGTGSGPAFPSFVDAFRVTGVGGNNVLPSNNVTDDSNSIRQTEYVYAQRSSATWDNSTDLRSITLQSTSNPSDPNKLTITRGTAQITDVAVGTGNVPTLGVVPVYYMASFTNGTMSFVDSVAGPSTITIPANQSLQLLGWGYTGDLFGTANSLPGAVINPTGFGTVVLFNLEKATSPTWNKPMGTAGTFSGQVAVAIGPTALYYGMTGIVNMPGFGLFNFSTNGDITDPTKSGAVGPLTGNYGRLTPDFSNNTVTPSGSGASAFCGTGGCYADIHFNNIFLQKIGVTYSISNSPFFSDSDPQIGGIATFAQSSSTPKASPSPTGIVSFVDTVNIPRVAATNPASGTVENTTGGVALKQAVLTSGETRTRGTATAADIGSVPGIISWERWTNGTFATENNPSVTIPQDAGVSFVYGTPATLPILTQAGSAPIVAQYSLIGATIPTISDGSVSTSKGNQNAFVGSGGNTTSKLGVDFTNMKVGFDMYVQIGVGYGQSFYNFATPGGAANPSSGGISFDSSGQFTTNGRSLPVSLGGTGSGGVSACTGSCTAGVTGFLSGPDATYAGLNYYFGNTTSTLVSGAAVFGRDMPITQAAAFAFADGAGFNQAIVGRANSQLVGDTTTSTGLSLSAFFIDLSNSSSSANFFRDGSSGTPAIVKEQGTLGGGFSGTGSAIGAILGWERWTNGTVTSSTNCTTSSCTNTSYTLSDKQGLHIVYGTPATNLPTSGPPVIYALAGATKPTVADGSVSPGTLQPNSTMTVQFGGASPNVSANLNVAMTATGGQNENYNVQGTMPLNNVKFDSGGLTLPVTNTGASTLCGSGCKGSIGGFLAGPGATGLGIFYQIGTSTSSPTLISGAAGFNRKAPLP